MCVLLCTYMYVVGCACMHTHTHVSPRVWCGHVSTCKCVCPQLVQVCACVGGVCECPVSAWTALLQNPRGNLSRSKSGHVKPYVHSSGDLPSPPRSAYTPHRGKHGCHASLALSACVSIPTCSGLGTMTYKLQSPSHGPLHFLRYVSLKDCIRILFHKVCVQNPASVNDFSLDSALFSLPLRAPLTAPECPSTCLSHAKGTLPCVDHPTIVYMTLLHTS